jgi:hypothetical protein
MSQGFEQKKDPRKTALALALVPLAAVAIVSADATNCSSGGIICGTVFEDSNNNGIQDAGEGGIEGAVVTSSYDPTSPIATGPDGTYEFVVPPGDYTITVQIPPGTQTSPTNVGTDDTVDSDGAPDGLGNSTTTATLVSGTFTSDVDFGFYSKPTTAPGTGTPGYWKNHPEAWPVESISIGGVIFTKAQALGWMDKLSKDKTTTMFSSLLSAKLNVLVGNDSSCVAGTITEADAWMAAHPVGSGVHAASLAWKVGEPLHRQMDNYNNGMLCAPHRD